MNKNSLKGKVIKFLRGDFNSVRYRFLMYPREKAYYYWSRITGYSWIDFYAERLNGYVELNNFKIVNKKKYFEGTKKMMSFLLKKGVKKDSEFLDFGCGFFRLGLALIPYLKKGKYTGVDISRNRIEAGHKMLEEEGIKKSDYNFIVNNTNDDLESLLKNKFDFIYLESVVTHMPIDDFKKLLFSFTKILKKNGAVFFTIIEGDVYKMFGIKDFMYPVSLIKQCAASQGFEASLDKDWVNKNCSRDKMIKLKFKK